MTDLHVVVLAAGKGTRMNSAKPKVLHELAGKTLITHVLDTAGTLGAASTILVIGHGADQVRDALRTRASLQFVVQSPQLGTGHALLQTAPLLDQASGTALLLYGDVPLLEPNTLVRLLERHRAAQAAATILTVELPDPEGYGRIVRDASGRVLRITEERDASPDERRIQEVNSGIYALDVAPLFESLRALATDNSQGEYYLTDLVALYRRRGLPVETLRYENPAELRGVNSRLDLADLGQLMLNRKRRSLMLAGVTLQDPSATYVETDVLVGEDTTLGPGVILTGGTRIGARCHIHAGTRITNSRVGDDVMVLDHCVIVDATVESRAVIGPFAHLRPGSDVGPQARVGNFVELKKTRLGARSKANHLTYLGDADIGADVNIGAGTITCNYDGVQKHRTQIGDGVFVGSDSQLVAPVTIGTGAYVAAGSSITEDVPPGALAVGRSRQTNKEGWVASRGAAGRKKE